MYTKEKEIVNQEAWEVIKSDLISEMKHDASNLFEAFNVQTVEEEFREKMKQLSAQWMNCHSFSSEVELYLNHCGSINEFVVMIISFEKMKKKMEEENPLAKIIERMLSK